MSDKWNPDGVHAMFKDAGAWNGQGALEKRVLDFCSASARMADAEMSGKSAEFLSSVGKTLAIFYDISAFLGYSPNISNISRAKCTYSVDLINAAIAWAYTAAYAKDRKSINVGKLGNEWLSHVWNCVFVKTSGRQESEIADVVCDLLGKQMSAQCIAAGIPASKYFAQQIEMDVAPQKVEVPF